MIRRTFDLAEIDELINQPDVRASLGGDDPLTAEKLIEDKRNIFLIAPGGGACFAWRGPGVYEGHSFFTARGREAIGLGKQMLSVMADFGELVWGLTPEHLRHVRWFNRRIGFVSLGVMDTPEGRCELFEKRF